MNDGDTLGIGGTHVIRLASRPIRVADYTGTLDADQIVARSGERPDALFRKPMDLDRVLAWVA